MPVQKKVVIAGHVCLDITPVFGNSAAGLKREDIFSPGKLTQTEGIDIHTGGAVANSGLALKKMGVDVALMGKVGEDELGRMLRHIIKGYDADGDMIRSEDSSTSYSIVLAPPGMDRIFLHYPGANDTFCLQDLNMEKVKQAALFHFGYPPLMKKMYQNQGKELQAMFAAIQKEGVATSLDLAAVDESSDAGKQDWKNILVSTLPYVDFFVPSVEELGFMLNKSLYDEWQSRANGEDVTKFISVEKDVKPFAQQLLDMGAKAVLIKCGAAGMYYKTSGQDKMRLLCAQLNLSLEDWSDKEGFEKSYVPDQVLSGTGAGDTTIAAFLASIMREYPLQKSVSLAAAQGASCVSSYDALGGLKTLDELQARIDSGWEKQDLLSKQYN